MLAGLLQSASRLCPLGLSLRPMAETAPSRTTAGSLRVAAPPCTSTDSMGLGMLPEHSTAETSSWAAPLSPLVAAPLFTSADSMGLGVPPEHSAGGTSSWAGHPAGRDILPEHSAGRTSSWAAPLSPGKSEYQVPTIV